MLETADPIDVAVGARIRIRRVETGLSQAELGARIGVTFQQIQKYGRGANRVSASMLVRAARALGCTGGFLLDGPAEDDTAQPGQADVMQAELNSLMATPGAMELLRAYVVIPSRETRAGVLAVVRGLTPEARREEG